MNPQLKTDQNPSAYFFDFPVTDVVSIGSAALNLIYYGSRRGAFGAGTKESIDLTQVDAFQITMVPRSEALLSDDYVFNLVYYRKELGLHLWKNLKRKGYPSLKELTRRVELGLEQSIEPHRVRNFYIKSDRPVHLAKYPYHVPHDDCVPLAFITQFNHLYEGFLLRSPVGHSLEEHLFASQGLALIEQRNGAVISTVSPHVMVFADRGKLDADSVKLENEQEL